MSVRHLLMCVLLVFGIGFVTETTWAQNQGKLPSPKETRPMEPPFRIQWDPENVPPDTKFYQLAANQRIENNGSVIWTVPTLGFREARVVVFMTEAEKIGKVASPSLRLGTIVRDGDKEFEIDNDSISIETGPGKTSGKRMTMAVYSDSLTLKVEARNLTGNLHFSVYLIK